MNKPRVFVAQPIYRDVPGPAAMSFSQLLVSGSMRGQIRSVGQAYSGLLSWARNQLVKQALAGDYTHALFVDADMVLPLNCLDDLLAADRDVVSALYFRRQPPYYPAAVSFDGKFTVPGTGLDRVDVIGMGCALIRTSVFLQMQVRYNDERWFYFETDDTGEDTHFCRRCFALNIAVYQHGGVKCGHVGNITITEEDYLRSRAEREAVPL